MIYLIKKHIILFFTGFLVVSFSYAQKTSLIIDADTANEMDDLYAITRVLTDGDNVDVKGIISSHFNNLQLLKDTLWHIYSTDKINTVALSQELNVALTSALNRTDIPVLTGADRMIGYAWAYYKGAFLPSAAGIDFIIDQGRKATAKHKINIAILGPSTNVATAIEKAPDIIPNIRVFLLGTRYNSIQGIWNKNTFNIRNDLSALDVLLDRKDLELWIMPITTAQKLVFNKRYTFRKLNEISSESSEIIKKRWGDITGAGESWIMWDLALIEAIIRPKMAVAEYRDTPPENTQRKIKVYTEIKEQEMLEDFWKTYKNYKN